MRNPYVISVLILAITLILSVAVGSVYIPPATLFGLLADRLGIPLSTAWVQSQATASVILFQLRLPRTVLVALVGAALAGSGASYQGLFRNPLADPYLIGVASGAGLGAVMVMALNWPSTFWGLAAVPAAAFIFGLASVALVYWLASIGRTVPTTNLILAGVALSSFTTAISSYLMFRSEGDLHRAVAWLMGGGTLSGWAPVWSALPYIAIGLGTLLTMGHALNVLQFGDEQAQQLGLPVGTVRLIIITAASLTTAAAVAFAGIIGFVGLVVPHVIRLIWGGDYKRLLPLSILGGASMLLLADLLARIVINPEELPVGVITALVGAPFFLWVLRRTKAQSFW